MNVLVKKKKKTGYQWFNKIVNEKKKIKFSSLAYRVKVVSNLGRLKYKTEKIKKNMSQ